MGILKLLTKEKEAPVSTPQHNKSSLKSLIIKTLGQLSLTGYERRQALIYPEYNLEEIREASEADSYIKMSLMKTSYLIYKAGWSLKGQDDRVSYLQMRFRVMSYATGKPMDILFQEIADDVVKYSNAFLLKARVDNIPGVKAKPFLDNRKVIGGYYRMDPASIVIERDKTGNIKRYIQGRGENERYFKPEDVIHIYMDRDANNAFGTPRIVAALDDVQLLRKIEGNVISLIYRFSRPIFHWKIGTTTPGFQATDNEIKKAEREAENMSYESMIITNEKTEIKAIGAEGTALNAEGYLKYFEERVFSALGTSATQMGRGTDKSSADSMDEQTHDVVKYVQRIIATHIEFGILQELLLEGGFNPIMNEEDIVTYEYEEISLETKIKKENHEMLKYQSNQITFEEARRKMGMKDGVEDEERLYKNMIEKKARIEEIEKNAEVQMQIQKQNQEHTERLAKEAAKQQKANQASTNSGGGSKKPKSSKGDTNKKATENNNRPQNQHGKTSVKVKESMDLTESFNNLAGCTKENSKKEFKKIFKKYKEASNDIKENEDIDLLMPLVKEDLCNDINKFINEYAIDASIDAKEELERLKEKTLILPKDMILLTDFYEETDLQIQSLLTDIKSKINSGLDSTSTFDALEYRLRFSIDFLIRKAYWYSFVKTGKELGAKKAYVLFNSDKDKKDNNKLIDLNEFTYDNIPAYHSFCDCRITFDRDKYLSYYQED